MFSLQHPEGKRELNELHIPVGQPVRLEMTSQDVIHSFYIPACRIKQDLLPGRKTTPLVHANQGGELFTCSAPSIAAPTIRGWAEPST